MFSRFPVPMRRWFMGLFFSSLTLCLCLSSPRIALSTLPFNPLPFNHASIEQSAVASGSQLVQQGVNLYQQGDYKGAIALWQTALQSNQKLPNASSEAIVRENLARAYQQIGQSEQAITQWDRVAQLYRQLNDQAQLGRALTEQAQTYSLIGQHRKAIAILCNANTEGQCSANSALQRVLNARDASTQVAALGSLGNAYRSIGEYAAAQKNLETSWQIASRLNQPMHKISALTSLGVLYNTLAQESDRKAESAAQSGELDDATRYRQIARQYDQKAIRPLLESLALAQSQNHGMQQLRIVRSLIPAYYRSGQLAQASEAWQQGIQLLQALPDSRDRVFAAIDLAHLLQSDQAVSRLQCLTGDRLTQAEALLQQAVAIAQRIQDARAASFALGELGHGFECRQDWNRALDLTQQARLAAEQTLEAKDSLYLWEWQTGRILKRLNQDLKAISAYERAIATLESIRGDILTATRDIQFDFRDTIEPIYRELVELKLRQETPIQVGTKSLNQTNQSNNFRSILRNIDSLKLAELQNYFGSECVIATVNQESIDLGAKTAAAVFNTIILNHQTAVIASLPNGQQFFTWLDIPEQQIINQINTYRIGLEEARFDYNSQPAQQLYDWLVRPFETALQQAKVNTLVFVQDGIFRTVPMTALHDGNQFLIQKYAIATTPSLTLTDPKSLQRNNLRVLALGLTQAATVGEFSFRPLPNVANELSGIQELIPGSKQLLDGEFTRDRLKQELSETVYPVLHVATHGKFATDPQDTFIVTGDAQKLTFNELDRLIRSVSRNTEPLELLSLTACETAVGNDRSALGLAGVAVQAGARSAIASLWSVNDAATAKLSTEFYAQLRNPQVSKAKALQTAQKAFIEGKATVDGIADPTHPAYWSSFVLIGNWL
ncbi:MAG: CHAT domain-containing protein [Leptolyngbyaceae cyanobacterium bins.302]|nr:CHAT domain-containing protein [Leptolyngbyaceae cyanobacterium bins.302]